MVSKLYDELLCRLSPVCQWHGPFLADIATGHIDKLVKRVVCRKDALGLGDFADLAVVALYGIGGVDDHTEGCGILKIATQQLPFVSHATVLKVSQDTEPEVCALTVRHIHAR